MYPHGDDLERLCPGHLQPSGDNGTNHDRLRTTRTGRRLYRSGKRTPAMGPAQLSSIRGCELALDEQRPIYEEVIEAVRLHKPLLMYVDGRSGRGKTLLMKVITAALRAQGGIVLCSATTGLAALNHEGGMTAHATYKFPVTEKEETPQCNVTARSQRAELLRASVLHIWDVFPMVHRTIFEAVNHCLCDIIGNDAPCGGRVFVCCGDFRQIPPVIHGGGKSTIVEASIRSSSLWENFELRNLSHPQRDAGDADYSRFIDRIGDGEVESTYSVDGDTQLMKLEPTAVTTSEEEAIQFCVPRREWHLPVQRTSHHHRQECGGGRPQWQDPEKDGWTRGHVWQAKVDKITCTLNYHCAQTNSMLYTQNAWYARTSLACTETIVHPDTPCCIHKTHGMQDKPLHAQKRLYTEILHAVYTRPMASLVYRQVILYYGFTLVSFPELACVIT